MTFKLNTIKSILGELTSAEQPKTKNTITSNVDWGKFSSLVESDNRSYKHKADTLEEDKSLYSLNDLLSFFRGSGYRYATLNVLVEGISVLPEKCIFPTIEDLLAVQSVGAVAGYEWNRVCDETIEHIWKEVSQKDHPNWSSALSSKDSRSLGSKISWKGDFVSTESEEKTELNDLASHFGSKG